MMPKLPSTYLNYDTLVQHLCLLFCVVYRKVSYLLLSAYSSVYCNVQFQWITSCTCLVVMSEVCVCARVIVIFAAGTLVASSMVANGVVLPYSVSMVY